MTPQVFLSACRHRKLWQGQKPSWPSSGDVCCPETGHPDASLHLTDATQFIHLLPQCIQPQKGLGTDWQMWPPTIYFPEADNCSSFTIFYWIQSHKF